MTQTMTLYNHIGGIIEYPYGFDQTDDVEYFAIYTGDPVIYPRFYPTNGTRDKFIVDEVADTIIIAQRLSDADQPYQPTERNRIIAQDISDGLNQLQYQIEENLNDYNVYGIAFADGSVTSVDPTKRIERAGKLIAFDSQGENIVLSITPEDLTNTYDQIQAWYDQIDIWYAQINVWQDQVSGDVIQTGLDVIATNADRVQTTLDVIATNADVVSTNADSVQTALDVIVTNADATSTSADVVQTGFDVVSTNADAGQTALDVIATNADVVQTGLDVVSTATDRVQTGLDAVATSADRVQTGIDAFSADADRVQTGLDVISTNADVVSTNADVVITTADTLKTNSDAIQTELDLIHTNEDVVSTNADVVSTNADVVECAGYADLLHNQNIVIETSVAIPEGDLISGATYIYDCSGGRIIQNVPHAGGSDDQYTFVLGENSNHLIITTSFGVSNIGDSNALEMSTENATVAIQCVGFAYAIKLDTRSYRNLTSVTTDLTLANGFASGAGYVGNLADGVEVTITLPDIGIAQSGEYRIGDYAGFIKRTGINSTLRIKSVDGSFDQTISGNNQGISVAVLIDETGEALYALSQDSRPKPANVSVNFFPTTDASIYEPGYTVLANQNPAETTIISTPILSSDINNPTSLGFFINDDQALGGTLDNTAIEAYAITKLSSAFNRTAKIMFKYYEYDMTTRVLNPVSLSETQFSSSITEIVYVEKQVTGSLPTNNWTGKTLVIELLGFKNAVAGDNPTITFQVGGDTPSRTTMDLPIASVNHDSLGSVDIAGTGVSRGHIDNKYPLQVPELSTVERDAIVANAGMEIYNTTTGTKQAFDGSVWADAGGGGGDTTGLATIESLKLRADTIDTDYGSGDGLVTFTNILLSENDTVVGAGSHLEAGVTALFFRASSCIANDNPSYNDSGVTVGELTVFQVLSGVSTLVDRVAMVHHNASVAEIGSFVGPLIIDTVDGHNYLTFTVDALSNYYQHCSFVVAGAQIITGVSQ